MEAWSGQDNRLKIFFFRKTNLNFIFIQNIEKYISYFNDNLLGVIMMTLYFKLLTKLLI